MLEFSQIESEELDLTVFRNNNVEIFSIENLIKDTYKFKPDLIRLKISMNNPAIFSDINNSGIPYNLYSFIIRKSCYEIGTINYKIPDLNFIIYTPKFESDLIFILKDLLLNKSGNYYTNEMYKNLISNEKMDAAGVKYYLSEANYNNNAIYYLGYINNDCVGVCSFHLNNDISEGLFFGIHSKYRSLGLAHEFLTYAKEQSFKMNAKVFHTNTLIQNPRSLYPQMNIGLIPNDTYVNVIFFPLLNKIPDYLTTITLNNFFNVLEEIYKWTESIGFEKFIIYEMKTINNIFNYKFPMEVELRLHIVNSLIIITVLSQNQYFYVYLNCKC